MTFEEALKKLAEKEPEKFEVFSSHDGGEGWYLNYGNFSCSRDDFTQDSIDEILALIGWEYEVTAWTRSVEKAWTWTTYHLGDEYDPINENAELYTTKLSAAKAALIAVVERHLVPA